jgi:hypothetical protein
MAKLNQIIAVEKGAKTRAHDRLTAIYQTLQKADLLTGLAKTYQPKDEEGEVLPPETKVLQVKVSESLKEVAESQAEVWDVTATKDYANCGAKADVVVDGKPLLKDVPVSHLLYLEKELVGIHTLISKLPTLDASRKWHFDREQDCYATDEVRTVRTNMVPRNHVLAEATEKHPAQVQVYNEDVVVGYWTKIDYSGALPVEQKNAILRRVEALQNAVKVAREEANQIEATPVKEGETIFRYLLGDVVQ